MSTARPLRPETLCAQGGHSVDDPSGAVVPPVHLCTTFARDRDYALRQGRLYGRDDSPAFEPAERLLAVLEGGEEALLFPSGLAAAVAVFLPNLLPGDRVVITRVSYFGVLGWLREHCQRIGAHPIVVDGEDGARLEREIAAARPKLVWIETPGNPMLSIVDIARAAAAARAAGALLCVDSTLGTPVLQRPLHLGADIVMHSATKYLNGHSDVLGGALVAARAADERWARIARHRHDAGSVIGPFEAWLLLRGLRTLFVRVERQARSAQRLAERLAADARVQAVHYPGLPSHPGHEVAARQMRGGFGGLLSFRVRGGAPGALAVVRRLRLFLPATSLGGVESLVEHRRTVEPPDSPTPEDLIRISVGLEDPDDLWEDLRAALG